MVLLGPQRLEPTVGEIVRSLGLPGPVAAITAGWEEREQEDDELAEQLHLETVNLELYRRGEELLDQDRDLAGAFAELRAGRRAAQTVYRTTLDQALATVRLLATTAPAGAVATDELAAAFNVVRALDARHLTRITGLEANFRKRWATGRRRHVRRHRQAVDELLGSCSAVAVAGGHVGILTDLLRIFGLDRRLATRTVIAWSAGAMSLGRRVVLFHDTPPQGFGNPEVWGPGLGLYGRRLVFPHATTRLLTGDPLRVSILSRRFAPDVCTPMNEGDRLALGSVRDRVESSVDTLDARGRLLERPK